MAAPSQDQAEFWNGPGGQRWVDHQEQIDAVLEPIGRRGIERAAPGPGERAVDIGCGCGQTSLELARRVGTGGAVLGVDLSEPMLGRARQRARERHLEHATFAAADASAYRFEGKADLLFSRFGVMFFADPQAAFRNLRTALKPGGRVVFVTWRDPKLNPWQSVPLQATLKFVPPPEPVPPDAPGPFALADPARFQSLLTGAGFTQVALEPCDEPMILGSSLQQAVDYTLAIGPTARLLGEASPEVRKKASAAIEQALTPFAGAAGVVLPAATWLASARA